ncbi:MAG: hypothetical protein ABFQ95_05215 [Pseudomonadota bacterium]
MNMKKTFRVFAWLTLVSYFNLMMLPYQVARANLDEVLIFDVKRTRVSNSFLPKLDPIENERNQKREARIKKITQQLQTLEPTHRKRPKPEEQLGKLTQQREEAENRKTLTKFGSDQDLVGIQKLTKTENLLEDLAHNRAEEQTDQKSTQPQSWSDFAWCVGKVIGPAGWDFTRTLFEPLTGAAKSAYNQCKTKTPAEMTEMARGVAHKIYTGVKENPTQALGFGVGMALGWTDLAEYAPFTTGLLTNGLEAASAFRFANGVYDRVTSGAHKLASGVQRCGFDSGIIRTGVGLLALNMLPMGNGLSMSGPRTFEVIVGQNTSLSGYSLSNTLSTNITLEIDSPITSPVQFSDSICSLSSVCVDKGFGTPTERECSFQGNLTQLNCLFDGLNIRIDTPPQSGMLKLSYLVDDGIGGRELGGPWLNVISPPIWQNSGFSFTESPMSLGTTHILATDDSAVTYHVWQESGCHLEDVAAPGSHLTTFLPALVESGGGLKAFLTGDSCSIDLGACDEQGLCSNMTLNVANSIPAPEVGQLELGGVVSGGVLGGLSLCAAFVAIVVAWKKGRAGILAPFKKCSKCCQEAEGI